MGGGRMGMAVIRKGMDIALNAFSAIDLGFVEVFG
jgi:hypothetical protein